MLEKARRTAHKLGVANAHFVQAPLEALPLPDESADWVTSNCTLNHAGDKPRVWREIARILKRGGRFVVSDIYAVDEIPAEHRDDPVAVSECWAGAVRKDEYLRHIEDAGLVDVRIVEESRPYEKGKARVASFTVSGMRPARSASGPAEVVAESSPRGSAAGAGPRPAQPTHKARRG